MSAAECLEPYVDSSPSPLVALVGEQTHHAAIMDLAPAGLPPGAVPVRYLSEDADTAAFDYHPGTPDEQPALVLKRDWLHKHTHAIAAVVVLWFAWEPSASSAGARCVDRNPAAPPRRPPTPAVCAPRSDPRPPGVVPCSVPAELQDRPRAPAATSR